VDITTIDTIHELRESPRDEWGIGDPPDLLNELIFGEGRLQEFDLVALLGEHITTGLVDIFEKQDLDIFRGEWLQVLRVDDRNRAAKDGAVAGWGVEGGAGGGSEEGGFVLTRTDISCGGHDGIVVL
jgi:hypothetical protein